MWAARPIGDVRRNTFHLRSPGFRLNSRASKYLLVTGATGLLGSYLVRDLLLAGRRLALVVRRDRKHSARSRVESCVRQWEDAIGLQLPRPVVLEGDLSQPLCRLDDAARSWIRSHCDEMLNNAASLAFRGSDRAAEPWLTNVTGTANVLALARDTGLRHLHHVSTAYVCGLRAGRVLEADLDVGQDFGNDYEKSKVEAEKLVRAADHLETATIYRPSIIVGDSQTGYTSTYHGLFAALRLGHTLLTRVVKGSTNGPALLALIGIDAAARKNFVPVDWVSKVIAHAVQTPAARGRTFHVTHPDPLSMDTVGRLVQEAVDRYSQDASPDDPDLCDEQWFAENLLTQLDVYTSYFRNDPTFDQANTMEIAGHIPCPTLDMPTLLSMARFAIEHDFGRKTPTAAKPRFDVEQHLGDNVSLTPRADAAAAETARLGLEVDGAGGGQWTLVGSGNGLLAAVPGIDTRVGSVCRLDANTFEALATRALDIDTALLQGSIDFKTADDHLPRVPRELLKSLLSATVLPSAGSAARNQAAGFAAGADPAGNSGSPSVNGVDPTGGSPLVAAHQA